MGKEGLQELMAVNLGMTLGFADMEHEETTFSSDTNYSRNIQLSKHPKGFNPNFMLSERNAEIGDGLRERPINKRPNLISIPWSITNL